LLDVFGVFLGMFIGSRLSPKSFWQRYVWLYFIFLVKGSTLLSSGGCLLVHFDRKKKWHLMVMCWVPFGDSVQYVLVHFVPGRFAKEDDGAQ
jgi:hypothetical protein